MLLGWCLITLQGFILGNFFDTEPVTQRGRAEQPGAHPDSGEPRMEDEANQIL